MSTLASQLGGQAVELAKAVTNVSAVLLGPVDVQQYDRYTVYVTNTGNANVMTTLKLETAPTLVGPYVNVSNIAGGDCPAATTEFEAFSGASHKYIRLVGTSLVGTTVNLYLSVGGLT